MAGLQRTLAALVMKGTVSAHDRGATLKHGIFTEKAGAAATVKRRQHCKEEK